MSVLLPHICEILSFFSTTFPQHRGILIKKIFYRPSITASTIQLFVAKKENFSLPILFLNKMQQK